VQPVVLPPVGRLKLSFVSALTMRAGSHIVSPMKTNLTEKQVKRAAEVGENGGSVTLAVIRAMPSASEADIDREINRVYDSMEYSEKLL
jgi:hypothetical protein